MILALLLLIAQTTVQVQVDGQAATIAVSPVVITQSGPWSLDVAGAVSCQVTANPDLAHVGDSPYDFRLVHFLWDGATITIVGSAFYEGTYYASASWLAATDPCVIGENRLGMPAGQRIDLWLWRRTSNRWISQMIRTGKPTAYNAFSHPDWWTPTQYAFHETQPGDR